MSLREALDRTLLLMRDEVEDDVDDDTLLAALTETGVALIADQANLVSHSAQTAFVTSALLMARSGHRVHLLCPDIPLLGPQPPLAAGRLLTELMRTGADLLPGVPFKAEQSTGEIDLAIALGDSEIPIDARRRFRLNAESWRGRLEREGDCVRWQAGSWPLGGMAAAALAGPEAFKVAMRKLKRIMRNPARLETVFAESADLEFALAPPDTPMCNALGGFDCVSGGAIVHVVLYVLARIPEVMGRSRVIEPDRADLTNLNRYMMLLRSHRNARKAEDLALACAGTNLIIEPVNERYDQDGPDSIKLGSSVLVGVDDIPTRWFVQRANPKWLGIGATTHWSAMASFHEAGMGCAECLHPVDDPSNGPIPTVAFVSFWAGILTATYFLRHLGGQPAPANEQQIFVTPFRTENAVRSGVPRRRECQSCVMVAGDDHMGPEPAARELIPRLA
jgi:hypothetical protein